MGPRIIFQSDHEREQWFRLVAAGLSNLDLCSINPPTTLEDEAKAGLVEHIIYAADYAIVASRERHPYQPPKS